MISATTHDAIVLKSQEQNRQSNPLLEKNIDRKIQVIDEVCHQALLGNLPMFIPKVPARDVKVVAMSHMPDKPGLSTLAGQARLLHDLASIELQAMELGFRTLVEFWAVSPPEFQEQLVEIIRDEARHLSLCLQSLKGLGFRWGDWPTHLALWSCVSKDDTLIQRIMIVHRYLEGSGLDAGDKILRRLTGSLGSSGTRDIVKTISDEEVGHVLFGSRWFVELCRRSRKDPDREFEAITNQVFPRLPRRLEKLNKGLRKAAGFSDGEINTLLDVQSRQRKKGSRNE